MKDTMIAESIEKSYVDPVIDKSCIYVLHAPKILMLHAY
jgi:hypothetical protein